MDPWFDSGYCPARRDGEHCVRIRERDPEDPTRLLAEHDGDHEWWKP